MTARDTRQVEAAVGLLLTDTSGRHPVYPRGPSTSRLVGRISDTTEFSVPKEVLSMYQTELHRMLAEKWACICRFCAVHKASTNLVAAWMTQLLPQDGLVHGATAWSTTTALTD